MVVVVMVGLAVEGITAMGGVVGDVSVIVTPLGAVVSEMPGMLVLGAAVEVEVTVFVGLVVAGVPVDAATGASVTS